MTVFSNAYLRHVTIGWMIPGFSKLPYCERLERLGLWSLEERRNRADIIEVFKMAKGWSAFPLEYMFELSNTKHLRRHKFKLVKYRSNLEVRRQFFTERSLLTDGTVWINSHWTWTRWIVLKTIYNAYGILGWVSSWTDVRLTHWLHKFVLVWPHQVNDQVNDKTGDVLSPQQIFVPSHRETVFASTPMIRISILAVNVHSTSAEIDIWQCGGVVPPEQFSTFTNSRIGHDAPLPPPLPDIAQVSSLKILGVTLYVANADHVQNVVSSCAQSLHALRRLLRAHGLCDAALQTVHRTNVVAKLLYAVSAWLGRLHHCRRPAAHWGISAPWFACRLLPRGRAYGLPAGRRLWWSAVPPGPTRHRPHSLATSSHLPLKTLCFARSATELRITLQTQFVNWLQFYYYTTCYFILFNVL